jgi:hypothetical protein
MNEPFKERRIIEEFQRRRRKCGIAVLVFLVANIYYGILYSRSGGPFVPFDEIAGIPVLLHFIVFLVLLGWSVYIIFMNWRCPNCDAVPYLPRYIDPLSGRIYPYDPQECPSCGFRLK